MKEKFTISVVHSSGQVLHSGIVACETAEELAGKLRAVANTIKGLDFDGLGQGGSTKIPIPRPA